MLIHGLEGLNRSAAVTMAYLMLTTTCLLDDVFLYIKSLRPHLQVSVSKVNGGTPDIKGFTFTYVFFTLFSVR